MRCDEQSERRGSPEQERHAGRIFQEQDSNRSTGPLVEYSCPALFLVIFLFSFSDMTIGPS